MCQVAGSVVWISLIFQFQASDKVFTCIIQALGCNGDGHVSVVDFMRAADLSFAEAMAVGPLPYQYKHSTRRHQTKSGLRFPVPSLHAHLDKSDTATRLSSAPCLHQLACTHAVPSPHSECSPAVLLSPRRRPARRGPGRASSVPSGGPPLSLRSSVARAC